MKQQNKDEIGLLQPINKNSQSKKESILKQLTDSKPENELPIQSPSLDCEILPLNNIISYSSTKEAEETCLGSSEKSNENIAIHEQTIEGNKIFDHTNTSFGVDPQPETPNSLTPTSVGNFQLNQSFGPETNSTASQPQSEVHSSSNQQIEKEVPLKSKKQEKSQEDPTTLFGLVQSALKTNSPAKMKGTSHQIFRNSPASSLKKSEKKTPSRMKPRPQVEKLSAVQVYAQSFDNSLKKRDNLQESAKKKSKAQDYKKTDKDQQEGLPLEKEQIAFQLKLNKALNFHVRQILVLIPKLESFHLIFSNPRKILVLHPGNSMSNNLIPKKRALMR